MFLVTDKFIVRTAFQEDSPILLESALYGFLKACPHARALQLTPVQAREFIRWIIERSLNTPYSIMIFEKSTGELAGFRLYSVSHRDESQDFEPFELDFDSFTDNVKILCNILDNQKNKIWELCPNVNKVLRQELTFIDPHYQRQGIGSHLLRFLNVEQLKRDGFAGIQSEATSFANQKMLSELGYKMLSESEEDEYMWPDGSAIIFPDETKSVQLFFLPFT
ncbi:hypothetical protein PRIPAC_94253 [Pristionchus pacificus]|uniref:N-acetyltransferase domain-containing protein n=1 Tax=Pristionchus pacificus TaxID=54126 RepID=A0A2A6BAC4_PRIPA|nr:hypothetical protein PRIPAC_94253 [Pristionchus pacificus]|eukprot:PDM62828.1 hypothetical protein PRIPAC_50043 [Pristionchus pacificus]